MTAKQLHASRASQLPAPAVGVIVKVPLEAWPEYARRHHLEVVGGDKKNCVVIVKVRDEIPPA